MANETRRDDDAAAARRSSAKIALREARDTAEAVVVGARDSVSKMRAVAARLPDREDGGK